MPGFLNRKRLDQSTWTLSDWLAARRWNAVFLTSWFAAFVTLTLLNFQTTHVIVLLATIVIAVFGTMIQVTNLIGMTHTIAKLRDGS